MGRLPETGRTLSGFLRETGRRAERAAQSSPFALSGITVVGDGTATITGEVWAVPALLNSWVDYGFGKRVVGFARTVDSSVKLRGFAAGGATGVPIFTLPPGYTPTADETFVAQAGGGGTARVDVLLNGDVLVASYNGAGTNAFLSLSGIRFSLNN